MTSPNSALSTLFGFLSLSFPLKPQLNLSKICKSKGGENVIEWSSEVLRYLGDNYTPKDRSIPIFEELTEAQVRRFFEKKKTDYSPGIVLPFFRISCPSNSSFTERRKNCCLQNSTRFSSIKKPGIILPFKRRKKNWGFFQQYVFFSFKRSSIAVIYRL